MSKITKLAFLVGALLGCAATNITLLVAARVITQPGNQPERTLMASHSDAIRF